MNKTASFMFSCASKTALVLIVNYHEWLYLKSYLNLFSKSANKHCLTNSSGLVGLNARKARFS